MTGGRYPAKAAIPPLPPTPPTNSRRCEATSVPPTNSRRCKATSVPPTNSRCCEATQWPKQPSDPKRHGLHRRSGVDSQGLEGANQRKPLLLLSRRHGLHRRSKVDSQGLEGATPRKPLLLLSHQHHPPTAAAMRPRSASNQQPSLRGHAVAEAAYCQSNLHHHTFIKTVYN